MNCDQHRFMTGSVFDLGEQIGGHAFGRGGFIRQMAISLGRHQIQRHFAVDNRFAAVTQAPPGPTIF